MVNDIVLRESNQLCRRISDSAWSALSWSLHKGWIQDYKWLFSEKKGMDISTPVTVYCLFRISGLMIDPIKFSYIDIIGMRGLYMFSERITPKEAVEVYKLIVEGYLLGTDFVSPLWIGDKGELKQIGIIPDEHGTNQLEGELRRYWAYENGIIKPTSVNITPEIVDSYCAKYRLEEAGPRFAKKLNL